MAEDWLTLGPWWLSIAKKASRRWTAPISSVLLLSKTPSSVVSGVLSNRVTRTVKGKVGKEGATGEDRM